MTKKNWKGAVVRGIKVGRASMGPRASPYLYVMLFWQSIRLCKGAYNYRASKALKYFAHQRGKSKIPRSGFWARMVVAMRIHTRGYRERVGGYEGTRRRSRSRRKGFPRTTFLCCCPPPIRFRLARTGTPIRIPPAQAVRGSLPFGITLHGACPSTMIRFA